MSGWIVLVTVAALLLYVYMGVAVSQARVKHSIPAPTMTGNPDFERVVRVQMNTLEWLPVFIAALWMCASYWDPRVVALGGVAWVVGRVIYMQTYSRGANRSLGVFDPRAGRAGVGDRCGCGRDHAACRRRLSTSISRSSINPAPGATHAARAGQAQCDVGEPRCRSFI